MAKRPSIEDVRNLGDFMVSNLWVIQFTNPKLGGANFDGVNMRAVSFEIPKRSGNSLEINIRGAKVKQPGDYDYSGQVTLTLAETEDDAFAHEQIRLWREAIIQTNTNSQERKEDVEIDIIIYRLNRDNTVSRKLGTRWKLRGCFLEDYELGDLADAGDVIQPTLTISYDYFYELGAGVLPGNDIQKVQDNNSHIISN